jgi:hypothetical protein
MQHKHESAPRHFLNSCSRYWPELLALAAALAFALGIIAHALFLPPTRTYLGFVQTDQPVYYACAREYFENGNGLFAANPYSADPHTPRHYSHLYFILVGWLWKLTGLSFTAIDGGVRLFLGPVMLLLAAHIFRCVHGWRRGANPMLALMLLGGGLAWLTASFSFGVNFFVGRLMERQTGSLLDYLWFLYLSEFSTAEGGYGDWQVQLFRNLFYAPEVFYHLLFFGSIILFLHRRLWLGSLGVFLAWWAHPYTGAELALVAIAWLAVERWRGDRTALSPLLAVGAVTALFGAYYGLWLARDPEHQAVFRQMKEFPATMLVSQIINAYGLLVPLSIAVVFVPTVRAWWQRSEFRLIAVWAAVAAGLTFQDKLVPGFASVQPLHFSHGYLYVPLAILALYGLRALVLQMRHKWPLRRLTQVAMALFLLHLPDTLIWTYRSVARLPERSILFAPVTCDVELLRALDRIPTTETIAIHDLPPRYSVVAPLIPVLTHHRAVFAHLFNTPYAQEKLALQEQLRENPSPEVLTRMKATAVLTTPKQVTLLRQTCPNMFSEALPISDDVVLLKIADATTSAPRASRSE